MLHTQFDLISLPSFQFTLYLAHVQTKVLLRRGRFSEEERAKGFNYLQGIMSTCTVSDLCSGWGGGVNVCSAALMSSAQPKDGASSANKPQGQREGSKQEVLTCMKIQFFLGINVWGSFIVEISESSFFLGSSISPLHPAVLSNGAGTPGNGHS